MFPEATDFLINIFVWLLLKLRWFIFLKTEVFFFVCLFFVFCFVFWCFALSSMLLTHHKTAWHKGLALGTSSEHALIVPLAEQCIQKSNLFPYCASGVKGWGWEKKKIK